MEEFDKKTYEIVKRLQNARLSLLVKYPFYALLLMYMKFSIDLDCETAYTDGERVAFNPVFLNEIGEGELEFVLMHEVLHAALGHPFRHFYGCDADLFNKACDVVVNSNILYSLQMDKRSIAFPKIGDAMHLTPDGDEGYLHSVEEVYEMLLAHKPKKQKKKEPPNRGKGEFGGGAKGEARAKDQSGGGGDDALEKLIASIKEKTRERAEKAKNSNSSKEDGNGLGQFDDHSHWPGEDEDRSQRQEWLERMIAATDIISHGEGNNGAGAVPMTVQREMKKLTQATLDWRTILNDFVQEEINDYSFAPPDKRMEDSPFFLPDFNEKDETVKDILFMVDTSGSMSDEQITACYSEILGAIEQFGGKLQGKLGFFDAVVVEPTSFENEDEFKIIRPEGGGGTSFQIIFEYVRKNMEQNLPVSIVILTDGMAPFPKEEMAMDIPVLWIINNEEVTPPWGKIARIKEER
ncbi:MAG: hypothetical protein E7624_02735 [Ruminococcaceae bacterium]|nr:hypothetical protein [Oscillospiraceae bacterium]